MHAMPQRCPQCSGSLKEGFVRDLRDRRADSAFWVEGPIERSFFLGVRLRGRRKAEITALRCDSCGRLELFAPTPDEG
jgi:hypothetical protein